MSKQHHDPLCLSVGILAAPFVLAAVIFMFVLFAGDELITKARKQRYAKRY